jgi:hypothetical protein
VSGARNLRLASMHVDWIPEGTHLPYDWVLDEACWRDSSTSSLTMNVEKASTPDTMPSRFTIQDARDMMERSVCLRKVAIGSAVLRGSLLFFFLCCISLDSSLVSGVIGKMDT